MSATQAIIVTSLNAMHTSDSITERGPERQERSVYESEGKPVIACDLKKPDTSKPIKIELDAASALTSLVNSPSSSPPNSPMKEVLEKDSKDEEKPFVIPERFTRSGRKKAVPFSTKLMKVLSVQKYSDIIAWLPEGESFVILRPKAFIADILHEHFKDAKYSSFTRKLHRWGFQRHLRGDKAGAFFHKHFRRGRMDLCEKMTCFKAPKNVAQLARDQKRVMAGVRYTSHAALAQIQAQSRENNRHPNDDINTLDIAFELEVTRRLRERVTEATVSRHALSAHQTQPVHPSFMDFPRGMPRMPSMSSHLESGEFGLSSSMMNPGFSYLNSGFSTSPGYFGGLQASSAFLEDRFKQHRSAQEIRSLDVMPPTSISHAKTA